MSQILRALIRETLMTSLLRESNLSDKVTSKHATATKNLLDAIIRSGGSAIEWNQWFQEDDSLNEFLNILGRAANIDLEYADQAPIATTAVILAFDDAQKDDVLDFWIKVTGTIGSLLAAATDPIFEMKQGVRARIAESIGSRMTVKLTKDAVENATADLIGEVGESALKAETASIFRSLIAGAVETVGPRGTKGKVISNLDDLAEIIITDPSTKVLFKGSRADLSHIIRAQAYRAITVEIDAELARELSLTAGKVTMYDIRKSLKAAEKRRTGLTVIQQNLIDHLLKPFAANLQRNLSTEAEVRAIRGLASTGAEASRAIARRLPNKASSTTVTKVLSARPNTRFRKLNAILSVPFATAVATYGTPVAAGIPLLWGNRTPKSGEVKAEIEASITDLLSRSDVLSAAANLANAIEPDEVTSSNQALASRANVAQSALRKFSEGGDLSGAVGMLATVGG